MPAPQRSGSVMRRNASSCSADGAVHPGRHREVGLHVDDDRSATAAERGVGGRVVELGLGGDVVEPFAGGVVECPQRRRGAPPALDVGTEIEASGAGAVGDAGPRAREREPVRGSVGQRPVLVRRPAPEQRRERDDAHDCSLT